MTKLRKIKKVGDNFEIIASNGNKRKGIVLVASPYFEGVDNCTSCACSKAVTGGWCLGSIWLNRSESVFPCSWVREELIRRGFSFTNFGTILTFTKFDSYETSKSK